RDAVDGVVVDDRGSVEGGGGDDGVELPFVVEAVVDLQRARCRGFQDAAGVVVDLVAGVEAEQPAERLDRAAVIEQQQVTDGAGALDQVVDVVEGLGAGKPGDGAGGQRHQAAAGQAERAGAGVDVEGVIDRDAVDGVVVDDREALEVDGAAVGVELPVVVEAVVDLQRARCRGFQDAAGVVVDLVAGVEAEQPAERLDRAAVIEQQQVTDGAGALDQVVDVVEGLGAGKPGDGAGGQRHQAAAGQAERAGPGVDVEGVIDRDAVDGVVVDDREALEVDGAAVGVELPVVVEAVVDLQRARCRGFQDAAGVVVDLVAGVEAAQQDERVVHAGVIEQHQLTDGAGALDQVVDVVEGLGAGKPGDGAGGQRHQAAAGQAERACPGVDVEGVIDRDAVDCVFVDDPEAPEIYTLSLHDALPIFVEAVVDLQRARCRGFQDAAGVVVDLVAGVE